MLYLALVLLYYFSLELTSGQTIGKKLLNIRVVTLTGQPRTAGQMAIRTVLRIVDGLPFLYLVGFVCVLVTMHKQRLGDMAANTIVVST